MWTSIAFLSAPPHAHSRHVASIAPRCTTAALLRGTGRWARLATFRGVPLRRRASHLTCASTSGAASWRRQACRATLEPTSPRIADRVLDTATALFPLWVVLGAAAAYIHPPSFLWFRPSYIVPTLAAIMLGMGLTVPFMSLAAVVSTPRPLLIGVAAQYTIMPLLARSVALALRLPPPLAAGLILVGVCPGGAASNLVCLIAQADVVLSIALTLASTLLSVLMIPLLMQTLAGTLVPVAPLGLLASTTQVVLAPLVLGTLLKRALPGAVNKVSRVLPLLSVLGVTCICGACVAANAAAMAGVGARLVLAVAAMHAAGGALGYAVARGTGLSLGASRTVSIEVMMQNSSLAVSLAGAHFANPLTAIPGAISATMHSVLGSLLAGLWKVTDAWRREKELARIDKGEMEDEQYKEMDE